MTRPVARAIFLVACLGIATLRAVGLQEPVSLSGSERLAWEFEVNAPVAAGAIGFRAYIDGVAVDLPEASCTATAIPFVLTCVSPVPRMIVGLHTISVSAYYNVQGISEGPTSDSLRVLFGTWQMPLLQQRSDDAWAIPASDHVKVAARVVARGLIDPTDMAIVGDGQVLISERSGRIRMIRDGRLLATPLIGPDDVLTRVSGDLLAIAVDWESPDPRSVFALYATSSEGQLVRFTLSGDTLWAPAVLLSGLAVRSTAPRVTLRVGPDGKLYLALDDGGDRMRADDLGSFNGKVLRLNRDGSTPDDSPGFSPMFLSGLRRPSGLAWQPSSRLLWIAATDGQDRFRIHRVTAPTHTLSAAESGASVPLDIGFVDIAFSGSEGLATPGDLLVAAEHAIMRLRADKLTMGAPELLVRHIPQSIKRIGVAPDGLYVLAGDSVARLNGEPPRPSIKK
jgi:glucose/arabinose dehydrogenase